jgi:hypothetical protein
MGLAIESVDLYCLAEVAGSVVPCSPQRRLNWLTSSALRRGLNGLAPNALRGRLDWLASQWWLRSWLGRAGLSNLHTVSLRGHSTEYLLHAWAKDTHHHLFEYAQESPVMLTQHVFRSIPKRLHCLFFLLQSCGVSLS